MWAWQSLRIRQQQLFLHRGILTSADDTPMGMAMRIISVIDRTLIRIVIGAALILSIQVFYL
jgi:hypothetical protein